MKLNRLFGGLLGFLLYFSTFPLLAQLNNFGDNTPSEALQSFQLASRLLEYGQTHEDPWSLVTAARILSEYQIGEANYNKTDESMEMSSDSVSAPRKAFLPFDITEILNQAKSYAEKDTLLLREISKLNEKARAPRARGYHYGYINEVFEIPANGSKTFSWEFSGNEKAEILFAGDGDTDLDFYVYDEEGQLLKKDESPADMVSWNWIPSSTKKYIFKVVNRGKVYNNCRVVSN